MNCRNVRTGLLGVFCAVVLFTSLISPAVAKDESNQETIRVLILRNFPPQFVWTVGGPSGLAVEIIEEIAQRASLNIEYVVKDSWHEVYALLESGRVDAMANMGISEERRRIVDFSHPYEVFDIKLFVRKDTDDIKTLDELGDRTLGLQKTNVLTNRLVQSGKYKTKIYPSFNEAFLALLAGEIDALPAPTEPILRIARASRLDDRVQTVGPSLLEVKRAIAVPKGRLVLLARLNRGLEQFKATPAYRSLLTKWYGAPTPFWTPFRISMLSAILLAGVLLAMGFWRYLSIVGLNRRLKASEERFALAMRGTNDGLWDWDLETGYIYYSPRWSEMLGYRPDELDNSLGTWSRLVDPASKDRVLDLVDRYINGKVQNFETEFRMRHKDGSWVDVLARAFAVFKDGKPVRLCGTHVDVTERRKAEEALAKSNADLEERVHERTLELEEARQSAESANKSKSAFLANMSHEIRTPMNGVVGMAEILSKTELRADQARMVKTIRDSSQSLLRIIDDILDVSKIEAGKLQLENAPLRLRDIAEGVINTLRLAAKDNNVRLLLDLEAGLPSFIRSDPVRLRQILMNLLGNAIKFSRRDGRAQPGVVRLRFQRLNDAEIAITVRDNGIGMSEDVRARLFRPFTQAEESTTRRFGGTGLGLVITENLVHMMGGSISVDSVPGEGSSFTVRLPFEEVTGEDTDPDISGLSLLALVDDTMNRAMIKSYLEEKGAYIRFVENEAELASRVLASKGNTIVFLALPTSAENKRVRQALLDVAGCVRFLVALADPAEAQDCVSPNYFVAQRFPLLPSELIKGVAVLAGRTSIDVALVDADLDSVGQAAADDAGRRILLVEDNEINQDVISTQIKMLGHGVEVAKNGLEGLAKWKNGRFDLVLADCHMPNMDGFDMTRAIREIEAAKSEKRTPIIAITANALQGEAERCKAAGMDDYLSKPVVLTNLHRMLKQWLSSNADGSMPSRARDVETVAGHIPPCSEAAVEPEAMVDVFGVDDRALFSDMMRLFVEKSEPDVGSLRDALQSKDNEAIVAIAHKLKAAARTIGANDLADLCEHIQRAEESGELSDYWIIGEEINARFDRVQRFVENYARS